MIAMTTEELKTIKSEIKKIIKKAKRNGLQFRNELEIPEMRRSLISEGVSEELIDDVITKYEYDN